MKAIEREVKATIKSIIDKRVVAMNSGETSDNDLLGILLDSNYKEIKEHGNNNFGLSIDEIIEECKLFYFAGQDTTGNTLVWTMLLLSQHIDWQTRAREEVLHIFGDRMPDINGLNHLKTVLWLYPVAPVLRQLLHEKAKLGNLTLPAGTIIQLNTLFFHHDKEIWSEDASKFNLERF
ncbi:putative secologanin synthase [Helianthus annuus]|nr:putative secologanin synthase [Helianthus annuus]